MNIAFVNSAWPGSWGGGEKWTVDAAEWFGSRGDEVRVIGRPQSKLLGAARGRGLRVREHGFGGDFDPLAILSSRRLLRESGAEIVVVNFNKEAWQFGLAARRMRIPVVARHGFPLLRGTLHHRWLVRRVLTRVVINARSIGVRYSALGYDTSGMAVIHNGVRIVDPVPGELRGRFGIAADELLVVAAGRVESQKRFDRVLDIARALTPRYPRLRFLLAGEGPMRDELEADVARSGLGDRVRFTGFIPDLAHVIGDADVFILTSDDEGTPNVLLEAMAARLACVAFAVGSVPQIFAGDLAAYAVAPGDVDVMTGRLASLLDNDSLRSDVAAGMRKRIEDEFSLDVSMERFRRLFAEAVNHRP